MLDTLWVNEVHERNKVWYKLLRNIWLQKEHRYTNHPHLNGHSWRTTSIQVCGGRKGRDKRATRWTECFQPWAIWTMLEEMAMVGDCSDCSVVKSTCCSDIGVVFNSQQLYGSSQSYVIPVPGDPMSFSGLQGQRIHTVHIHADNHTIKEIK